MLRNALLSASSTFSNPRTDCTYLLQDELARRTSANQQYSLRAFARHLSVDPSLLSKILRGKRALTPSLTQLIGGKLNWPASVLAQYPKSVTLNSDPYISLSHDQFRVIADWYHYGINECARLDGFSLTPKAISTKLGISLADAKGALTRLLRLGVLKKVGRKIVWGRSNITTMGNPYSAVAFRKLQRQLLEKAIDAMETIPMDERSQTSMTMAVNSRRLAKAKLKIVRFQRDLCRYLEGGKKKDQVYQLAIALYPLSSKKRSPQ